MRQGNVRVDNGRQREGTEPKVKERRKGTGRKKSNEEKGIKRERKICHLA